MKITSIVLSLGLGLGLALAAACGDDGDKDKPADPPPTQVPVAGDAAAAEPALEVPTATDFEEEVNLEITEDNLEQELEELEKDIGDIDEPAP